MPKKWFPIESNPEVMNVFLGKLGLNTAQFGYHDVLAFEDWAYEMIPKPVIAVLMVFPVSEVEEEFRHRESAMIEANGQEVSRNLYYMKQTISNACGTIGLLHSVGNGRHVFPELVFPDSHLDKLLEATKTMTPDEIANYLEEDTALETVHEESAQLGQSEAVVDVDAHFVCFTCCDGCLYELDGRKKFPINHGPSTQSTLLADAARVIRGFMDRQPDSTSFTTIALAGKGEEDN